MIFDCASGRPKRSVRSVGPPPSDFGATRARVRLRPTSARQERGGAEALRDSLSVAPALRNRRAVKSFVPLAVHSYYSFLNSTLSIQSIVQLAKEHGLPALALTDERNLHGAVEFTQFARAAGIKPILGAELRVEGQLLRVYVENAKGYANLCRLLSLECSRRGKEALSNADFEQSLLTSAATRFCCLHFQQLEGLTDGLFAVGNDERLVS